MRKFRCLVYVSACAIALAGSGSPLGASETKTYTYDARGRLVAVVSSGTVNNGQASTYCYDKADNRTQVISNTSGAPATCSPPPSSCTLTAINVESSDEFSMLPRVEKVGACASNITLAYSIQYVSGPGNYTDGGFSGGNVLTPAETYKGVWIYPTFQSVPAGQQLVLNVTFTTTTPGVTISPGVSTVTIFSSY